MGSIIRKLGVAFTLAFSFLAAGCADAGSPLAPDPAAPAFSASASPDVAALAKFRNTPQVTIAWAKKWIGPAGGRLDFNGFAIEVPAGAVDKVTMFSIRLPVDPQGAERVVAEFGPHNSDFAKPIAIELPYRGTTIESGAAPTIVWWNGGWVNMGATVTADGQRLRTLTDHFSTYGTTDAARGGTFVTSGG
ncbi:hypothetical protein [Longimicrobium sp.]|uniref:hypothetical protein n=1 Tax=Longimicrobium sp. TaxID=2029185 RepID=UPI003B3B627C